MATRGGATRPEVLNRRTRPMLPTANTVLFPPRVAETAPSSSWWLNLDRQAFFTRARQETDRFRRSPFGTPTGGANR